MLVHVLAMESKLCITNDLTDAAEHRNIAARDIMAVGYAGGASAPPDADCGSA